MAVIVPLNLPHPDWCHLPSCTAYAAEDEIERRRHRSAPRIIPNSEGDVTSYLHVGSDPSGTDQYLEIVELLEPDELWWHPAEPHNEIVMTLAQAAMLSQTIIGLLAEVVPARAMPVRRAG